MNIQVTDRDLDVFRAVEKLPLTTDQLFRLSGTFATRFNCQRILQRRLKRLADHGLLKRFYFAFARQGRSPAYWKLSRSAYRLIYSVNEKPKRSLFQPIGVSLHFHSYHLSEFLIRFLLDSKEEGVSVESLNVESSLEVDSMNSITPDATVRIRTQDKRTYKFFVELDTASERVSTDQKLPSEVDPVFRTTGLDRRERV